MQIEKLDKRDILQQISNYIHLWIDAHFPDGIALLMQITARLLFLFAIFWISLFLFKIIVNVLLKRIFFKKEKYPFLYSLYRIKANKTVCRMLAIIVCELCVTSVFQNYLPKTGMFTIRFINFLLVMFSAELAYKGLKAVEYYYAIKREHYRVIAIKAITQTVRPIGIVVFIFIGISIIFGIKGSTIFGYVSAFTAVFFLIFRDFILGFITGMHVATQRTYKVGDWIRVDKYDLDGTIEDISSLTTKVKNFDHTISTIPTYDLLNTEVKNFEVMKAGNKRRIKKSITFNINSFAFLDEELFRKLEKISLISNYLKNVGQEIHEENLKSNNDKTVSLNSRKLTNIGVFRKYVEAYLENNPNIDQTDTILARQLEITPQGLPLEIYCFTIYPDLLDYERIQADIFDHLLVASKEFDLEVMQTKV